MVRFLVDRTLQSILVILLLSFVIYAMIGLMPGDPIDLMITANPDFTSEDAARLKKLYGLDQPIIDRYLHWLGSAVQGDLGYSRIYGQPVVDVIGDRLANTAILLGTSLVLSLLIAIPLGVVAAMRPHGRLDYLINLLCFAGISAPPFWLALLAIMFFSITLDWFPAGGLPPAGSGPIAYLHYAALPVLTLTVASVGGFTRFMRASMMETLQQDYIRTAKAKGVGPARLIVSHALRNALIPLATIVALSVGTLFSGALITETMFSWLGMGKAIFDAILGNDYNLALTGLMLATILTLIGNLLADIAYVVLDPRLNFRGQP